MKLAFLAIAALLLAPAAALAAPAPTATWVVDHAASKLTFSASVSGKPFTGAFRSWDAVIHFNPKDPAHGDVTATINIASAFTGDGDRDAELPDKDWLWTSHFPQATFVARGFQPAGPGRYTAAGVLTIRGAARPLTLPFTLAITGASARMTSQVSLNRLAFGIGQGEWQATDTVPAGVNVAIDLTAHRKP
ncbi:MAG TPA: YceI family protein [Caulobacteraceae bacterium]|jgi:polyisoprenoid-binding protein YceI|nr:YceI family protein [Caulobacteraceae bacterium]